MHTTPVPLTTRNASTGPQLWPPCPSSTASALAPIKHPVSSIDTGASSIEYQASGIRTQPSSTEHPASSIGTESCRNVPPTVDIGRGTLNCGQAPRRPRGKIAELPPPQRDLINQLLDSGATYKKVALKMAELGLKLNAENISNWFHTGYQTHLQHKLWLEQIAAVRKGASDLLDDYDAIKLHQAANQLATIQVFKSLKQERLTGDPVAHARALNVLARLGHEALALAKYQELSRPEPDDDDNPGSRDLLSLAHNLLLSRMKSSTPPNPSEARPPTQESPSVAIEPQSRPIGDNPEQPATLDQAEAATPYEPPCRPPVASPPPRKTPDFKDIPNSSKINAEPPPI